MIHDVYMILLLSLSIPFFSLRYHYHISYQILHMPLLYISYIFIIYFIHLFHIFISLLFTLRKSLRYDLLCNLLQLDTRAQIALKLNIIKHCNFIGRNPRIFNKYSINFILFFSFAAVDYYIFLFSFFFINIKCLIG